jgi:RNAse (barnase) inhibitor barstar
MNMDYRIALTGSGNRADLHDRLQEALPLPVWYGRNLDAFYDCLTEQAEEWNLTFCGTGDADAVLPAYMDALRRLCRAAQAENDRLRVTFEQE